MAVPPQLLPYERQPQESPEAFRAFKCYLNLGSRRTLDEAYRQFCTELDGGGLKFSSAKEAPKKRRSGKFSDWSRQHNWVARAAEWDRLIDARIREKQLDEIAQAAKRHADHMTVGGNVMMSAVLALGKALQDPLRRVDLETAPLMTLFEMAQESLKLMPRLQKAERLARGVKVIDTEPISAPGSSQGGATWNVIVHQPERAEPLPDLNQLSGPEPEEWEDA